MTVNCAKCGEELLGSVNRCWKCGTEFASLPDPSALPPVRRVPPVEAAVAATTDLAEANAGEGGGESPGGEPAAGESPAGESPAGESPAVESPAGESPAVESPAAPLETVAADSNADCGDTVESDDVPSENAASETASNDSSVGQSALPPVRNAPPDQSAPPPVRTAQPEAASQPAEAGVPRKPFANHPVKDGSPFALNNAAPLIATPAERPALRPSYPRNAASVGGAYASLCLGVLSLLGALLLPHFPLGPLLTSIFGLAMGAWGLYSKHRVIAAIGLLLCCISLGIAGFFGAVKLYEMIHGVSPFATDPNIDERTGLPLAP